MAQNPFTAGRIAALTERVRATTKAQIIGLTNELTERNQRAITRGLGGPVPITRYVDGVLGKPLNEVRPDGVTLTEFETFGHIVDVAIRTLIEGSPYGPEEGGHYRDDHWLFVNGQRRDAEAEGGTVTIRRTDEVVIINVRPYARKIEGGARQRFRGRLTDRRPGLSVQAPNGVYEIAARDLARRFGNLASIRFTYRGLIGGGVAAQTGSTPIARHKSGRFAGSGGTRAHNVSFNRFPAIEISARA